MTQETKLKKIVNSSGFPLQIGIKNLVDKTSDKHGWRVLSSEHSWKNQNTKSNGFIDLVLVNRHKTSLMIIECKRVLDSSWIFLQESEKIENRHHMKSWITRISNSEVKHFDWKDITGTPVTPESSFCVVAGQDNKSRPMLERIAAEVTEATEGFAYEELKLFGKSPDELRMYFNVIVTTAKLQLFNFNPDEIAIENGKLDKGTFKAVPYLRFRKQLSNVTAPASLSKMYGYSGLLRAKENTIFVVNSEHFDEFLTEFEINGDSLRFLKL